MTLEAGKRDQLVIIQRRTATSDDYGGEGETWNEIARRYAQVLFGTGQERREAAQEGAAQSATFGLLHDPITVGVTPKDRLLYLGAEWDIQGVNPTAGNRGVSITATRRS